MLATRGTTKLSAERAVIWPGNVSVVCTVSYENNSLDGDNLDHEKDRDCPGGVNATNSLAGETNRGSARNEKHLRPTGEKGEMS